MAGRDRIPVAPKHHRRHRSTDSSSSNSTTGSSTPHSSGGGGSNSSSSPTSAEHKAANRYVDQARTLQLQADALRIALGKHGFRQALHQKLANVRLIAGQQDAELLRGYKDRVGSLKTADADNTKAYDATSFDNLGNAGRERANALSEVAAQGAGESDLLAAQGAALRNWSANQGEATRAFFDTKTSINSSLTDLTTDTRTARFNTAAQLHADESQLFSTYYDQRSQTLTALGNTYGQMAEDYGFAQELDGSGKHKRKDAVHLSGQAFRRAARQSGRAYKDPGISSGIRDWSGAAKFDVPVIQGPSLQPDVNLAKPTGATLRRWET